MRLLLILLPLFIFANELKNSTSPYLLQHKDNPVNWMEWSNRAFQKAKKENKFIFLSIGYSTCHWCHVMARESFEDKEVAKVLNKNFISIKVDRERRVDLDRYYQKQFNIVNGRGGGWPLTVIMLPNKKPIFFGTYLPKDALLDILNQITHSSKDKLNRVANSIQKALKIYDSAKIPSVKLSKNLIKRALFSYKKSFDKVNGGFGNSPKFPQASTLETLLNIYKITKDKDALNIVTKSLNSMAKGGIYDQIDGGFFRYSVDSKWQIPHFEKMLYTNAELISLYAKAYEVTKSKLYKRVVKESIENIEQRFLKDGVYYSASNADSLNEDKEEQEGYYFIFDYQEALDFLLKNGISKSRAKEALKAFGIEPMGNFEGGDYSNPRVVGDILKYQKARELLKKLRARREYPFIDKKINTAWNALYIKALFDATKVDKKYSKLAQNRLHSLLNLLYKDNVLYHQTLLPHKPTQKALLEDYAFLADTLFSAYQNTLDEKYNHLFREIVKKSVKLFYKNDNWYVNNNSDIKVKADYDDSGYKSAVSKILESILKDVAINGDYNLLNIAKKSINNANIYLKNGAIFYPTLLNVKLMQDYGLYIIKAKKSTLINLKNIIYPYIYKEVKDYQNIQICGLSSCFISAKSVNKALKQLVNLIDKNLN